MKPGDRVSHYELIEQLGAGGMGVVYRAHDTRLKRTVALKFLSYSRAEDSDAKERLVQEAQAASALDHPNICTIHEIDETADGQLFVAMAYYDGETLRERTARGPLPIEEALDIVTQVARGVAAAHDAGIVHRDIKPGNIMVTRRHEVKLLDFGIAKQLGQTALTRTGTMLGTVAYMAPEQVTGRGVDNRSDVWALGVVLYEALTGRLPFSGEHEVAIAHAIVTETPTPLRTVRADVPEAVDAIVTRALQKEPGFRFASARAFVDGVESLQRDRQRATLGAAPIAPPATAPPRARFLLASAAALVVVAGVGWYLYNAAQLRTARQTLEQIPDLIEKERYTDAYLVIRRLEPLLADDPKFAKMRDSFLMPTPVRTEPPGADVYVRPYQDANAPWDHIGQSPLEIKGPQGMFRWRLTKPGYDTLEVGDTSSGGTGALRFVLSTEGSLPDGMVRVVGGAVAQSTGPALLLPDFLIDQFEVTNRAFKAFVDAGGYRRREFWTEAFTKSGRTLSWDDAMAEFRDATGRPGPSTWELGTYPEGEDDFPVRGVSWYEAAAYASFAGRSLPTVHHWRRAARPGVHSAILGLSNFAGKGVARVGSYQGMGPYGTYDMAGNVKEWCFNAIGDDRYTLGGAWNEPAYMAASGDSRSPFDRGATLGFRTIEELTPAAVPAVAMQPMPRLFRDYGAIQPVSDSLFDAYRSQYAYDAADLAPMVESVDDQSPDWRVERVTYAAAYDNERIIAYLFLPKRQAQAPYQAVVYFPHTAGEVQRDFQQFEISYLAFMVKSGHALLLPMYKGFYERRLQTPAAGPNAARDLTIKRVKDVRRSVDYLMTRTDVDPERISYFGVSAGAWIGPIALAMENRFKAAVFWSGGLSNAQQLPEADPVNFASRVRTPVLMLNGREDFIFPIESSQRPLFRMLGSPAADKRHELYDGGHIFPFARVQKDSLEWLDRYLGVPE
jgi:dienelactone hydrolase